ncbi:sugar transferase [Roseibium sp. SCPC15]|uniref:sugar transferase n=1 Tax=Roseibium sp. SCP15 TaxID=3141376 RepID=UPI0033384AC0
MANETGTYAAEDRHRQAVALAEYVEWRRKLRRKCVEFGSPLPDDRTTRRKVSNALKRMLDIAGASAGLVLLFPLLAAIAIAIKVTSRGPIFFRQQRIGLNGKPFIILKFRTMHQHLCDTSGVLQTVTDDPRVTWIGNFLRKSNFDELPQLINVLKGEMSLVGPRPHVPGMLAAGLPYEEFDQRYMDRHMVRPGITGLAQINGCRGETNTELTARMRLEYDLIYIRAHSIPLDITVLGKTVVREFFKGNGY